MYKLKTDRQIKDKIRKEKCSAINTLTIELIKKHEALKYAFKRCKIEEHSQLSQSDNYKIISVRLSLAYDYQTTILNKPQFEAIRLIFVQHFCNLQQLIYQKFGNTNPQTVIQGLYTKSINDLLVFKQTFQNNRDDIDQICQNLIGLYNQNIADQPKHARDRKKLALIIKKYSNYFKNQSFPQKAELLISTKDSEQQPRQIIGFDLKRSSSVQGQLEVDRKIRIILSLNPLIASQYQTLVKQLNIQNKQIELTQENEELIPKQFSLEMQQIDQIAQNKKILFIQLLQ